MMAEKCPKCGGCTDLIDLGGRVLCRDCVIKCINFLVAETNQLKAIVSLGPTLDQVRTALAAGGSMCEGKIVFTAGLCECDPDVGLAPCRYCAIHDALVAAYNAAEAAKEQP